MKTIKKIFFSTLGIGVITLSTLSHSFTNVENTNTITNLEKHSIEQSSFKEEVSIYNQGDVLIDTIVGTKEWDNAINLSNGNIMLTTWEDPSNIIVNQSGTVVKSQSSPWSLNTFSPEVSVLLNNGNILLAGFGIDTDNNVAIINQSGTSVRNPYRIGNYSSWTTGTVLNNGNILLAGDGTAVILNQSGNVVVNEFNLSTSSFWTDSTLLSNGNIMLVDEEGYLSIISSMGSIIRQPTKIDSYFRANIIKSLNNGDVIVAGENDYSRGSIFLLNSSGTIIKDIITEPSYEQKTYYDSVILTNGTILLIGYYYSTIIDNQGNIIRQPFLNNLNTLPVNSALLNNGNIITPIPSTRGKIVIFDGKLASQITNIEKNNITSSSIEIFGSYIKNQGEGEVKIEIQKISTQEISYTETRYINLSTQELFFNILELDSNTDYKFDFILDGNISHTDTFKTLIKSNVIFDFDNLNIDSTFTKLIINFLGNTFRYGELYIREEIQEEYNFVSTINSAKPEQEIDLTNLKINTNYYVAAAGTGLNGGLGTDTFVSNEFFFRTNSIKPETNIFVADYDIGIGGAYVRTQNNSWNTQNNFNKAFLEYSIIGKNEWIIFQELLDLKNQPVQYIVLSGLQPDTYYSVRIKGEYIDTGYTLTFKSNVFSFKTLSS